MKSISRSLAAVVLLGSSHVARAVVTTIGCYSSAGTATFDSTSVFNSLGYCSGQCAKSAVFATTGKTSCYCGDGLPPSSAKVDDSNCNISCPGYPSDNCGGSNYYYFYNMGTNPNIGAEVSGSATSAKATSTPSSTTSAKPSVVTVGGETVIVTAGPSSSSSTAAAKSGGTNKAAIAAGAVVGVVAAAALIGGIFLFMRNRKRRAIEEEHRRNAAVSNFIGGGKPPTSSGGTSSFTDTRLDPAVMAQRRMSDGSIADNQDYSRRILKVTNA